MTVNKAMEITLIKCSNSELDMLAAIIQCEAGGESYKGQVAVGAVVVNRVKSGRYPDSVESVIKQKRPVLTSSKWQLLQSLKKRCQKLLLQSGQSSTVR